MPIRYTNAPTDYDGFGTRAIGVVGICDGKLVRQVSIHEEHLEWQENRYASGTYPCWPDATELMSLSSWRPYAGGQIINALIDTILVLERDIVAFFKNDVPGVEHYTHSLQSLAEAIVNVEQMRLDEQRSRRY